MPASPRPLHALAALLGLLALAGAAHAGSPLSTYVLHAVARTGGSDRCFGVPPDSTITSSRPGINRAGSAAVRFYDTTRRVDGVACYRRAADQTRVILSLPRPDPLGLTAMLAPTVGVSGSAVAVARLDDPGLIQVLTLDGELLENRRTALPAGTPTRISLAGERLAVSSGAASTSMIAAAWLGHVGDGVVDWRFAPTAGGPFLALGPGTIDSRGLVTAKATTPEGDALVRWNPQGDAALLTSLATNESIASIGDLTDAHERGGVACTVLESSGLRALRRYAWDGSSVTLVREGDSVPGGTLRPGSLGTRTPSINASGLVVFAAADENGPAVFQASEGRIIRVLGWGDSVNIGGSPVLVGLGSGSSRQVVLSDASVNDFGEIAVVARLRDGTSALIIASPAGAPLCAADLDHDGTLTPDDLGDFITLYFETASGAGDPVEADYNRDEHVDADDLADFILAYFGGDCGLI